MPDEKRPHDPDDQSDIAPSTLFLEMMRQAAARQQPETPRPRPANRPRPPETKPQIPPAPPENVEVFEPGMPPDPVDSQRAAEAPAAPAAAAVSKPATRTPIYNAPEGERETKLDDERVRRLKRRQERRRRRNVGILGGFMRTSFIAVFAALLASTIFTWFTEPQFIRPSVVTDLLVAESTSVAAAVPVTATPIAVTPNWLRRIGIVSGHRGPENDPGAVCPDGFTEAEVNFAVAQIVVRALREQGFSVDLLDEFDPRLENYQSAALVSIHSNDCRDYGEFVSGFLVARAAARPAGGLDDVLAECIGRDYLRATQLERRFSLTIDMTDYHTFREIHPLTPAAIIELGFLRGDRDLLENQQDRMASGIINGILCFLNGENPLLDAQQTPTAESTEAVGG